MKNYISKILITLGTLTIFLVGANFASAFTYSNYSYDSTNCSSSWTTPIGCSNSSGYSQYNYNQPNGYNNQQYAYNNNQYSNNQTDKTPVINNYYYQINPASKAPTKTVNKKVVSSTSVKTNSNSNSNKVVKKNTTNNTTNVVKTEKTNKDKFYSSGLTALSLHGSNSFIPDTFWQWLMVVVLILIIVILTRLINKTVHRKKDSITPVH